MSVAVTFWKVRPSQRVSAVVTGSGLPVSWNLCRQPRPCLESLDPALQHAYCCPHPPRDGTANVEPSAGNQEQQRYPTGRKWLGYRHCSGHCLVSFLVVLSMTSHSDSASYGCTPRLSDDPKIVQRITESVDVLMDHLDHGHCVYGNHRPSLCCTQV